MRLVGKPLEVYQYLEPLYNDYRRVRLHQEDGTYALSHVDEVVDDMLRKDFLFDIALPRVPARCAGSYISWFQRPHVVSRTSWNRICVVVVAAGRVGHAYAPGSSHASMEKRIRWAYAWGLRVRSHACLATTFRPQCRVAALPPYRTPLRRSRRHVLEKTLSLDARISVLDEEFDEAVLALVEQEAGQAAQQAAEIKAQLGTDRDRDREGGERERERRRRWDVCGCPVWVFGWRVFGRPVLQGVERQGAGAGAGARHVWASPPWVSARG